MRDPIAAYTAASDLEAAVFVEMLLASGIEAHVVEDVSRAGAFMFGLLPEILKPQIFVERTDVERARALVAEFERQAAARRAEGPGDGETVDVVCEECSTICTYPAARWGYVETCPHCGAFVDVGEPEDWEQAGEE